MRLEGDRNNRFGSLTVLFLWQAGRLDAKILAGTENMKGGKELLKWAIL